MLRATLINKGVRVQIQWFKVVALDIDSLFGLAK
jgi:hypothetical protein